MIEVINKAYKFRIYPDTNQEVFFAKHFGCVRFVYNYLLATRSNAYKNDGISISLSRNVECEGYDEKPTSLKSHIRLWLGRVCQAVEIQGTLEWLNHCPNWTVGAIQQALLCQRMRLQA